eukprot:Opistho-2@24069
MRFGVHMHLGKAAFKFKFFATIHAATIRHDDKDVAFGPPCVTMSRGSRSSRTRNTSKWETTPADGAYRSIASFGDEVLEMVVTLYKDSKTNTFEKKEYKFAIEDARSSSKGASILAHHTTDLAAYASLSMSTRRERLPARPARKTVGSADIEVTIACEFLKQGNATDDDMMSTFSRQSQADNNSDDEEEREKHDVIAEIDEEYGAGAGDTPAALRSRAAFPNSAGSSGHTSPTSRLERATQTGGSVRLSGSVAPPVFGNISLGRAGAMSPPPPTSIQTATIPPMPQAYAQSSRTNVRSPPPPIPDASGTSAPPARVASQTTEAVPVGSVAAIAKRLSIPGQPGQADMQGAGVGASGSAFTAPGASGGSIVRSPPPPVPTSTYVQSHSRRTSDLQGGAGGPSPRSVQFYQAPSSGAADMGPGAIPSGYIPPPPQAPSQPLTMQALASVPGGSGPPSGSSSPKKGSAGGARAHSPAAKEEKKEKGAFFSTLRFFRKNNSSEELAVPQSEPAAAPPQKQAVHETAVATKKHGRSTKEDAHALEIERKDRRIAELEDQVLHLQSTIARLHATVSVVSMELEKTKGGEMQLELERREAVARMDLKGWLYKRGDRGPIKLWKRRWFATDLGGRLYYYGTHRGSEPYGYIDIDKITGINIVPDAEQDKNHATFIVSVPGREYFLQAHDAEAMNKWIESLDFVRKLRMESQKFVDTQRQSFSEDGVTRLSGVA